MPTLRSLEALESEGLLSPDPRLQDAAQSMAIAITSEMVALIDRSRLADDPIARQFVPSGAEVEVAPGELADPIGDEARSPVKGIGRSRTRGSRGSGSVARPKRRSTAARSRVIVAVPDWTA